MPTDAYGWTRRWTKASWCRRSGVSVRPKFQRQGIRYDDLSEEEKDEWDTLDWGEDGDVPDAVAAEALNGGCSTRTPSTRCSQT